MGRNRKNSAQYNNNNDDSKRSRRSASKYDNELVAVCPKNDRQRNALDSLFTNHLTIMTGPPGTAKTFLATYAALKFYRNGQIDKIYYVKPIVDVYGDNGIGYLKGDIDDKTLPHIGPVIDSLSALMGEGHARALIDQKKIEFLPLEVLRGRSLGNAFIIADEMQNATPESVFTVLTRMGQNSRVALCGDAVQRDLDGRFGKSGLVDAMHRLRNLEGVEHIHFKVNDIVRHGFVRDVVMRYVDWYDDEYQAA